jgi:hypothetical protein
VGWAGSWGSLHFPRASRQRLFNVARNLSMLAFPEGGMTYDWDLTYILDGTLSLFLRLLAAHAEI